MLNNLPIIMENELYNALNQTPLKGKINKKICKIIEDIFNAQYDAVAILNTEPKMIYVNNNYERVVGYKKEEIINRHVNILVKEKKFLVAPSLDVLKTKQTNSFFQRTFNGGDVLITASPLFNEDGEIILIVDNIRDVTDLNKLKEESLHYRFKSNKYEKELLEYKLKDREKSVIIYRSESMSKIIEIAIRAAYTNASVLITGESGVGKGLLAKFIHLNSSRQSQPFININCSAIPENLFESELFGYEEGAFSGAKKNGKPGLFEIASKGTIFLDEITEMPINIQSKFLNVLQEGVFYRVGGIEHKTTHSRIISATNSEIKKEIVKNKFRKDLYYRLNVIPIFIPPLRERKEDIIPLTINFLNHYNQIYNKTKKINFDIEKILISYDWPGNIRELQNTVERLVIMDDNDDDIINKESVIKALDYYDLSDDLESYNQNLFNSENTKQLKDIYKNIEYKLLTTASKEYKTSRKIAQVLGISHPTVLKKMKMYNINLEENNKMK